MKKASKKRAPSTPYVSQSQLTIEGFETPFSQNLDPDNRWVQLAGKIPWDELANLYFKRHSPKATGRPSLNPRLVIGSLIIKHLCNLDDRETISQITENIYMQYFLGYSAFSRQPPFDPSLFVEIRKRMGEELLAEMNLRILKLSQTSEERHDNVQSNDEGNGNAQNSPTHKGDLLMDATVSPQAIAYPTDLNLLNEAREIAEKIIDLLHTPGEQKPRTYRRIARKEYLKVAKNCNPSRKVVRKAVGKQLGYLKRNITHVHTMLDGFDSFPLLPKLQRQFWVIQTLYDQQRQMHTERKHRVEDRIVSIHQPHVRPMVRNKAGTKVEFGSKLHLSLVDGFAFVDTISWDAFHEGKRLPEYVANYKRRFGFYPKRVLADQIYCTRANRKWLKEQGIKLAAKPLGRPSAQAVENHVSPGERNPVEGKFGQAKNGYGMNRIRARLKHTSQSWIASIILVLNLVKLAGQAPLCLSFSAQKQVIEHSLNTILLKTKEFIQRRAQIELIKRFYKPIPC
ncbi:MAG TPA: IS5 family transposase [Cyclobacteriaceae bacterium]